MMLVTHANKEGVGLTPLSGDRRGYTPPLLKTKTATVTYVNLQDRKERIQIPDVVVSWLLVELRRTYADRRKYRSRRSSRVRFKASRRSDLICSSTAFD